MIWSCLAFEQATPLDFLEDMLYVTYNGFY